MEPVTIALLGTFGGGMLLRWFEVTVAKSKSRAEQKELDDAKLAKEKELEAEANRALACPYYFSRDYEDRMIEAGIMTKWERNVCDSDDCHYCDLLRRAIKQRDWEAMEQRQHEELEKAREASRNNVKPEQNFIDLIREENEVIRKQQARNKRLIDSITNKYEYTIDHNLDAIIIHKNSTGDLGPN